MGQKERERERERFTNYLHQLVLWSIKILIAGCMMGWMCGWDGMNLMFFAPYI